jgi:NTE family protein
MSETQNKKYKLGLSLSGGGARGIAHLGVYQALLEKGMEPDIVSGTSAGALVGSLLCAGKSPEELLELFASKNLFSFIQVKLPNRGLLDLSGLEKTLLDIIPYKRLEDLPKPLVVAVSDLKKGRVEYLREGPISKLVTASSCIPILFNPIEWEGRMLVDGGLFDNLPVRPIRGECDQVIAVNASPLSEASSLKNLAEVAVRVFELGAGDRLREFVPDLLIEPRELAGMPLLDNKQAKKLFRLGYEGALNALA